MKKWFAFLISLLLITGMVSISLGPSFLKKTKPKGEKSEGYRIILIQNEEKKGETDPHMLQILKETQKKLDEWLKSLNERIESEDVTRFEVRFLEILRNILEWIKEKIDAKIESSEKEIPKKKPKKGRYDDVHHRDLSFFKMG
jgi:PHP family Zn ribbon phosphoesterase